MNPAQLLNATVVGNGPHTVLFGNGFATTQNAWDAVLPQVPDGWRVVCFDYVGTTAASAPHWIPDRYRTYAGHADDLQRLLVHLDVRNAVFVAHSMSGMVGALASIRLPERLSHLVMIGASACYANRDDYLGGCTQLEIDALLHRIDSDLAAWMAGFSGPMIGRDATPHQLQRYLDGMLALRPDIGRTLLHSIFRSDYRDLLEHVAADTTILQTDEDLAVPMSAAEYLAHHTRCRGFHVLAASGHLPHVTHPELVAPLLAAVLTAHAARPLS
jgi:sigma-B regulation protein RsbQ